MNSMDDIKIIKPIPTEYNGLKFRSRLEARWAVFFDVAKIKYEYEPEGYETEQGERYLPDFYLPDFDTYVEVKRNTEEGINEIIQKCEPVIQWGGAIKQLLILSDIPGINPDGERWAFPILYWVGNSMEWGWWTFWETNNHDVLYGSIVTWMGFSWSHTHRKVNKSIGAISAVGFEDGYREKVRQIERILGYREPFEVCLTKEEKMKRQENEDALFFYALLKAREARFEFKDGERT